MLGEAPVMGVTGRGMVAVTVLVVRLMTETVQLPSGWAAVGAAQGRLGLPPLTTEARVLVVSCRTPTMRGLMPTGTVARTVPKPTASTGFLGSQLGLVGRAAAEQRGMLMMLTEPAWTPSPALAPTISLRAGAKSAQS